MGGSTFMWVALAVWLLGGVAGYYYLYRQGHPHPIWMLGALVLGPFSLLVFMDRVEPTSHVLVELAEGEPQGNRVVVGFDGSADAEHALDVARRLVTGQAHTIILCEVVDYDTEDDPRGTGVATATERLERAAAGMPGDNVTVEVLAGRPVQALADAAERHHADIIVVGTRGRGVSRRLLGSVAEGLLSSSARPVLVTHRADN